MSPGGTEAIVDDCLLRLQEELLMLLEERVVSIDRKREKEFQSRAYILRFEICIFN
jgi:hypothetical protein